MTRLRKLFQIEAKPVYKDAGKTASEAIRVVQAGRWVFKYGTCATSFNGLCLGAFRA